MNMPKLLIVDPCGDFRDELAQILAGSCILRACGTGSQAWQVLETFRPQIMVMELMLPEIDGISLLQKAHATGLKPAVLVTSRFTSDYVAEAMEKMGVRYFLRKPCDARTVAAHVADLAAQLEPVPITQADLQSTVSNLLLELGFSTKLDGFGYLLSAIPIYAADPRQSITKELYTAVGKVHCKDAQQVERSIRNAIDVAWRLQPAGQWQRFFPSAPDGYLPRPTNGAFISRLADHIARHLQQPIVL